jgi:hypothetical protein
LIDKGFSVLFQENEYFELGRSCCNAETCPLMTNDYDWSNLIKSAFVDPVFGQNVQHHALFSQREFRAPLQNAFFHSLKHLPQFPPLKLSQDLILAHAFPPRDQNLVAPSPISV